MITVNGNHLRNMPEQISKNCDDIIELQEASNNHEIRITALEQGAIALATFNDCTFTGTTAIQGDLVHTVGNASFANNVSIGGTLSVAGASSFAGISASGNASISGSLTSASATIGGESVDNAIKVLKGTQDVNSYYAYEGDINMSGLPSGLECNYAHWRVSNGKLSLVLCFNIPMNTTTAALTKDTDLGYFAPPSWVMDKIKSLTGANTGIAANIKTNLLNLSVPSATEDFYIRINKYSATGFSIQGILASVTTTTYTLSNRVEFNFMLT